MPLVYHSFGTGWQCSSLSSFVFASQNHGIPVRSDFRLCLFLLKTPTGSRRTPAVLLFQLRRSVAPPFLRRYAEAQSSHSISQQGVTFFLFCTGVSVYTFRLLRAVAFSRPFSIYPFLLLFFLISMRLPFFAARHLFPRRSLCARFDESHFSATVTFLTRFLACSSFRRDFHSIFAPSLPSTLDGVRGFP